MVFVFVSLFSFFASMKVCVFSFFSFARRTQEPSQRYAKKGTFTHTSFGRNHFIQRRAAAVSRTFTKKDNLLRFVKTWSLEKIAMLAD